MPHMNQAASVMGGTTAMIGGMMAQATPDASISNTGIVIGAGGLIVAIANGLFPYWKSWLDSKKMADDIEELKRVNEESERKIREAKEEADRKIAALERAQKDAEALNTTKRHAERNKFQQFIYQLQDQLAEAKIMTARLEGKLGSAINANAGDIKKVADQFEPPIPVVTPHIDVPPPGLAGSDDSFDDLDAVGRALP